MAGPFNFEAELGQLKRKQELADALQKGMLSGELPTGGGLGGLLTAIMRPIQQRRLQGEVTSGMADLQGRYKQELGKELEDYIRLRSPSEKTQWTGAELSNAGADAGVPQLTPEMLPGKPRQAAAQAMASQFPQLQAIGKADMEQLAKGMLTTKDLLSLPNMDPKSALAAAILKSQGVEDTDALRPLSPKTERTTVNGQVVEFPGGGGGPRVTLDARDKYGSVGAVAYGPDGQPILGQTMTGTGEVKFAPKGTTVNVNTQQKADDAFAVGLAGDRVQRLSKSFEKAQTAAKSLSAVDSAQQQLSAGIKSGSLANVNLAVAKLGHMLGMSTDPQVVNTEAYTAAVAQQIAQFIQNFGTGNGLSEGDRIFSEKASAGDITGDPKALERILTIAKVAAGNVLMAHDRLVDANLGGSGAIRKDVETYRVPFELSAGTQGAEDIGYNRTADQFRLQAPGKPGAPAGRKFPKSRTSEW